MKKKETSGKPYISDYQAHQLLELARLFYSDPKNVEKYRQWHFETYGTYPDTKHLGR